VFEKPSAVDSAGPELALALPISGHTSSGIFENHFAIDSDASEVGSDEWSESAMPVHNSSALLTKEHQSVLDAFRLLNEDPSLQVNMARLYYSRLANLIWCHKILTHY
jgi:hypothetical protein